MSVAHNYFVENNAVPLEAVTGATHVVILMATYNGERYLQAQLDSFAAQTHSNWSLRVSDDGSTDSTISLIQKFEKNGHNLKLSQGPRQGTAANFMNLIKNMPTKGDMPWIAFSDQDDVWLPDKLERAVSRLVDVPSQQPALYFSRTLVADKNLKNRRLSVSRAKPPGFCNALVQNVVQGNTILLNPAAARIVATQAARVGKVVVHDWWIYQIISGAGGVLVHDDVPSLLYRQHMGNVIGVNTGWKARMDRIWMLLNGKYRIWNDINITALNQSLSILTPEHRLTLLEFQRLRNAGFILRLRKYHQLGLYRQTALSTLVLWLAAVFGRL